MNDKGLVIIYIYDHRNNPCKSKPLYIIYLYLNLSGDERTKSIIMVFFSFTLFSIFYMEKELGRILGKSGTEYLNIKRKRNSKIK